MSTIQDKNKIDGINDDAPDGPIQLIMLEDRDWTFGPEQIEQLEDKISTYYNFVVTGQLTRLIPNAKGRKCVVELKCQFMPPKKLMDMFPQATALFAKQAIAFRVYLVRSLDGSVAEMQLYP